MSQHKNNIGNLRRSDRLQKKETDEKTEQKITFEDIPQRVIQYNVIPYINSCDLATNTGKKCIYETNFKARDTELKCRNYCENNFEKWFPSLLMEYDEKNNVLRPRISRLLIDGIEKDDEEEDMSEGYSSELENDMRREMGLDTSDEEEEEDEEEENIEGGVEEDLIKIVNPNRVQVVVSFHDQKQNIPKTLLPSDFSTKFAFILDKKKNPKNWKIDFSEFIPYFGFEEKENLTPKHIQRLLSVYKELKERDFSAYEHQINIRIIFTFSNYKKADIDFLDRLDYDQSEIVQIDKKGRKILFSFDYDADMNMNNGDAELDLFYEWNISFHN